MNRNEMKHLGSVRYRGSMFLPKYEQIIQALYEKAGELDNKMQLERTVIPTIEDLNKSRTELKKREY